MSRLKLSAFDFTSATKTNGKMSRYISREEVAKHATKQDCWVILHGNVYNMTPFLDKHPGEASDAN